MTDKPDFRAEGRSPEHLVTHATAQAALMLVESLALALIENGILDREEVVDAFENVVETKRRLGAESEDTAVAAKAVGLVNIIVNSLRLAGDRRPAV